MNIDEIDLITESANAIKGIYEIVSIIEISQVENIPTEVWYILADFCYKAYDKLKVVIDGAEVINENYK